MNDCFFYIKDGGCKVLTIAKCPENCKFKKSKKDFNEGIKKSKQILSSKNLHAIVKNGIVTVEKVL